MNQCVVCKDYTAIETKTGICFRCKTARKLLKSNKLRIANRKLIYELFKLKSVVKKKRKNSRGPIGNSDVVWFLLEHYKKNRRG